MSSVNRFFHRQTVVLFVDSEITGLQKESHPPLLHSDASRGHLNIEPFTLKWTRQAIGLAI